jgi:AAHS family 4-hydroxybenzoate transporter-like MFS transporter
MAVRGHRGVTTDVARFIDSRSLAPAQCLVVALCFAVAMIDGFDTAAVGFIAPALGSDWTLTPAQLAPLFGAGLAGLMIGAFLVGPLADKFGRKPSMLASIAWFGLTCLASARSDSLSQLVTLRFLTGLGLGGAMPCAVALVAEHCPERRRAVLITTMFCGFTVGSAFGGVVTAGLIDAHGWRSVLTFGGAAPLALVPFLAWLLPESPRFLAAKGADSRRIAAILKRIAPHERPEGPFVTGDGGAQTSVALRQLFAPRFAVGTLLLWLTFFVSLLVIYLLSSWLPTLIVGSGRSLETAALVTAMFQAGGTLGAVALGWLMDRVEPHRVLAIAYVMAGVCISAIAGGITTVAIAGITVFAAGFCISGSQTGINALAAAYYPTECRSTGVGWANGAGRTGSVLGAVGGGALVAADLPLSWVFVAIGAPALVAGAAVYALGRHRAGGRRR